MLELSPFIICFSIADRIRTALEAVFWGMHFAQVRTTYCVGPGVPKGLRRVAPGFNPGSSSIVTANPGGVTAALASFPSPLRGFRREMHTFPGLKPRATRPSPFGTGKHAGIGEPAIVSWSQVQTPTVFYPTSTPCAERGPLGTPPSRRQSDLRSLPRASETLACPGG